MPPILLPADPIEHGPALQAALDSGGVITLPAYTHFIATPAQRYLRVRPGTVLRPSPEGSVLKLGPDSLGGDGFNHHNYGWHLLQTEGPVTIEPGIDLQAPDTDPALWVNVAQPTGVVVTGDLTVNNLQLTGNWSTGLYHRGGALDIEGAGIEAVSVGLSAFSGVRKVRMTRFKMNVGHERSLTSSSAIYNHQIIECDYSHGEIAVYKGTCISDKGTNSVGRAPGSFSHIVMRGLVPNYVTGIHLDHFADRRVESCHFDASLAGGMRVRGRAQSINNVFECFGAFGGFGGGTGDRPVVQSIGDRFIGVSQIWVSVMRNGWIRFVDPVVWPAPGAILWSLPNGNADAETMRMEIIRPWVRGDVRSMIEPRAGKWYVEGPVLSGNATHGVFFAGPEGAAQLTVRGGEWPQEQTYYHAATPEAKERVRFLP